MGWAAFLQVFVVWTLLVLVLALVAGWPKGPIPIVGLLAIFVLAAVIRVPLVAAANGWWLRRGARVKPGDYIRLQDHDVEGFVASIGWLHTQVQSPTRDSIRIPNTQLMNSMFTNFHMPRSLDDIVVDVDVDMRYDAARVVGILTEATQAMGEDLVQGVQHVQRLPGRVSAHWRYVVHGRVANVGRRDQIRAALVRQIAQDLRGDNIRFAVVESPHER